MLLLDGEALTSKLAVLMQWWATLEALEQECKTDAQARTYRRRMAFPLWEWLMMIFITLREHNFAVVLDGIT